MDVSKRTQRKRRIAAVVAMVLVLVAIALVGVTRPASTDGEPPTRATRELQAALQMSTPPASTVDYRQFERRILHLMQDPNMVGLAVGTIEGGHVRFVKGYGETLAESGLPVTPDTVFRWASLSKGVAAALVVGLAGDGKLALDAPVLNSGTSLTLPGEAAAVTVADVLSHRVGLVRNAFDKRLEAGEDPRTLRRMLGSLKPQCPPATCYGYQNIAFDTVTEIVETTTGRDYASVAGARLFGPLGMTSATLGRIGLQSGTDWAHPHHAKKAPATVNDNYYRIPAAGGVNSSIRDLVRWMQAQTGGAPGILPPKALETMHRARVPTPPRGRRGPMDRALTDAAYGLGWRSYSYAGHALVGHRGSVDGYGSLILFDPAARSGIVMLWNSNFPAAARLQLEFFDLLYGLPPTDWLALPLQQTGPAGALPQPASTPGVSTASKSASANPGGR